MNKKAHPIAICLFILPIFIFSQEMFVYNETNSPLTSNKLTALAVDSTNAVCVGSDTTLFQFKNNLWLTSLTSSTSFKDIEISPNGKAYTITNYPNTIWENPLRGWRSIVTYSDLNFSPENIAIKNDTTIYFPLINQWPMQLGENNIALYNGVDSLSIIIPEVMMDGYLSRIFGTSSIAPLNKSSLLITDWEGFHIFNGVDWQLNNPDGYIVGENYVTTKVKNIKDQVFVLGESFYEFINNSYSQFPEIDSVLAADSSIATCIILEKSGIYWIGTSSGKLIKYAGYAETFELTSSAIKDIAIDKDGNKWFISEQGLFVFNEDKIVSLENNPDVVSAFKLYQNYPNPFNPSTEIRYEIGDTRFVTLIIYDILGREIETLVNLEQSSGSYKINFNAKNLTTGVYYYRLQCDNYFESKKMLLLK